MADMLKPESSVVEPNWTPKGPGQFGLATGNSLTVPAGARAALIQAEGADVRYRDDGGTVDASTGILLSAGASIFYTGDLSALTFAGTGTLNVLYYGWAE